MPLYEYKCEACEHRFEKIRKFSDPPLEACPKCGGRVEKQVSSPAIQFKGSGWYITDYAKKPSSDKASGSKGTEKSTDTPGESSTSDSTSTQPGASSGKTD